AAHRDLHSFPTRRSSDLGVPVRVATRNPVPGRSGTIRFDWADPDTHPAALHGMDQVFLVPPINSVDPAPLVDPFLDEAQRLGVRSEEHTSELQSRENLVC